MYNVVEQLKGGMIVSCQSEGDDPFNQPQYVALFAKAAEMGGACGIRTEGVKKLLAIKDITNLPVIGLIKSHFADGLVRITGSWQDIKDLLNAKSDIIAIDGTFREREGLSGPAFIKEVKSKYPNAIVLADIATYKEALACQEAGADCVSTTLSGYTPDTLDKHDGPDYELVERLVKSLQIPLFAEGRINTPLEAQKMMELGAYAVITGTAITRPRVVTQWFVNAVKNV